MTDEQDAGRASFGLRWKIAAGVGSLLLLTYVGYMYALQARIDATIAEIRDAGLPTTPEELDAWYVRPEASEPNAALVYERAFAVRITDTEAEKLLPFVGALEEPSPGAPLDAELLQRMEAYLVLNAACLELLHEAAHINASRYSKDMASFVRGAFDFEYLSESRREARLLSLEAIYAAATGDTERAVRATDAMFGIAASLRNEPLLISWMVRISIDALAIDTLHQVVQYVDLAEPQLAKLRARLEVPIADQLERGLAGERVIAHEMFIRLKRYLDSPLAFMPDHTLAHPVVYSIYTITGAKRQDHAAYLQIIQRTIDAAPGSYDEAQELERHVESLPTWLRMTQLGCKPLVETLTMQHQAMVLRRSTRAAIAAKQFRLVHGRWPSTWAELGYADGAPPDPFAAPPGATLQMLATDDAFTVYGVGRDGHDDGGNVSGEYSTDDDGDAGFRMPR